MKKPLTAMKLICYFILVDYKKAFGSTEMNLLLYISGLWKSLWQQMTSIWKLNWNDIYLKTYVLLWDGKFTSACFRFTFPSSTSFKKELCCSMVAVPLNDWPLSHSVFSSTSAFLLYVYSLIFPLFFCNYILK